MSRYTVFNIALGIVLIAGGSLLIRSREQLRRCVRASIAILFISFPWDFFAIAFGAWDYNDPGPRLFTVPMNDLAFFVICSFFAAAVLSWRGRLPTRNAGESSSKHGRHEDPHGKSNGAS